MVIKLNQREWKGNLGKTAYSIYRWGCTTVDVTAIKAWYDGKMVINPTQMAQKLQYTKDGLLIWASLKKVGMKLVARVNGQNDKMIQTALKHPTQCVILQVEGNHWVWATGRSVLGGYKIMDSWFGDFATTRRYKSITGFAIVDRV